MEFDCTCSEKCCSWEYCSNKRKGEHCDQFHYDLIDDSELLDTTYYKNYSITKWHWVVHDTLDSGFDKIIYVVAETKYGTIDTMDKARECGVIRETYDEAIAYIQEDMNKPKGIMRLPDGTFIYIYDDDEPNTEA